MHFLLLEFYFSVLVLAMLVIFTFFLLLFWSNIKFYRSCWLYYPPPSNSNHMTPSENFLKIWDFPLVFFISELNYICSSALKSPTRTQTTYPRLKNLKWVRGGVIKLTNTVKCTNYKNILQSLWGTWTIWNKWRRNHEWIKRTWNFRGYL